MSTGYAIKMPHTLPFLFVGRLDDLHERIIKQTQLTDRIRNEAY